MSHSMVIRAVDCGYGHIKFTEGRDEASTLIRCDSFPSQSPTARDAVREHKGPVVTHKRDTFLVEVNGRRFEVGREVALAGTANAESEILDTEFALSDAYAARLYGALGYMAPSLKAKTIDYLVLGLPLTTIAKYAEPLSERFTGEHILNTSGTTINVKQCVVYPQPLGAYMAFLHEHQKKRGAKQIPMALVIDPGYNTVDFFVCRGMAPNESRSDAVNRGMSSVLRAIAEKMINTLPIDTSTSELVRRLDAALGSGEPLMLYGKPQELAPFLDAGGAIIDEAAQAVKNKIGSGADIDVIVLAGGGARLYEKAIRSKFPRHDVITLAAPSFANVRGFQILGENIAKSAARASTGVA